MAMNLNTQKIFPCLMNLISSRHVHVSSVMSKTQAGIYRPTPRHNMPLTYEMANPPHEIAHRKSWNSWNTSNLQGGLRRAEMAVEDVFIRRFITGTWHGLYLSEVMIKRQHNIIRIGGILGRNIPATKMYFLIGYTEELLSYWLQCIVKLEIQTVADRKSVIYKYI